MMNLVFFKQNMFCNKTILGDNLEATCTFLTTCTVNNTKLKAQQKNKYLKYYRKESVN